MKKLNVLFPAVAMFFAVQSCQKAEVYQEVALTQTINQNESYTFELPITDDPYRIITEAQHATISLIGVSAEGNPIYSYTPAADFIGTDSVVLQTYHNKEGKKGHHGKGKHRDEEDHTNNYSGGGFCGTGNQRQEVKEDRKGKCGNESNSNTEDDYTVTITISVVETTNLQNMKTTL